MSLIFDDVYFMRQAIKEAHKALEMGEVPIGALIVCQNKIIARGHNLTETLKDTTAHAEMIAITAASSALGGKYLKGCTLYVTLEPCPMCAGALAWSQIDKIVFGATDSKRGYLKYSPMVLHPKTSVVSKMLEEETAELLKSFFQQKRKK
ncbi:tRNA-specific adenosine deaminase [Bacteroidales bacterium]|nr:tRNA-specific adenosine deaminase [Bacteroidales bacterium]